MVYMKYSSQLTDSYTVRKQHYFVCKMIHFKLSITVVVQYWCYLTSVLHLTLLIMKNLEEHVYILWHKGRSSQMFHHIWKVVFNLYLLLRAKSVVRCSPRLSPGPVLFTIYTTLFGRIIQRYGLTYHLYADDSQLYMAFKPSDVTSNIMLYLG